MTSTPHTRRQDEPAETIAGHCGHHEKAEDVVMMDEVLVEITDTDPGLCCAQRVREIGHDR